MPVNHAAITVNAVAPDFMATGTTQAMPKQALAVMIDHASVGRAGTSEDVAADINGAVLSVDGGLVPGT